MVKIFFMDTTVIFLKYLGFFYIVFALGLILNKKLSETLMDIIKDDAKLFLLALFTIFFSLPIVIFHNVWDSVLSGIVSAFGWLGLLKGFVQITFPDYVKSKAESQLNPKNLKIRSVLTLILGLVFLYCVYDDCLFDLI